MAAKVPADKSLSGAVKSVQTKDEETGETKDVLVQDGYGEWPFCTTCQPARQIDPVQWAQHANDHIRPVD